jgi:dTDP-glucose 4,6-dehydratase
MRILVTGAAGFIGSAFVRRIMHLYDEEIEFLTVVDNLSATKNFLALHSLWENPKLRIIEADVSENETLKEAILNVDYLVHFAAESHVDNSILGPRKFFETNVLGTLSLLETAKLKQNLRFLQISTDEVYGSVNNTQANESFPLKTSSPYSASKASSDLLVQSFHNTFDLDVVTTRSVNNFGPYQLPEKLIPKAITNLILGRKIPVFGNGQQMREWIYVDDNCDGIWRALIDGKSGEIYNLTSGNCLRNIDLLGSILSFFRKGEDHIEYVADRPGHDFRYSVDGSKSRIELNFEVKQEFLPALESTVRWYVDNQPWWQQYIK